MTLTTIYLFFGVVYLSLILWGIRRRVRVVPKYPMFFDESQEMTPEMMDKLKSIKIPKGVNIHTASTYHKELPSSLEDTKIEFIWIKPKEYLR